MNQSLQRHRVNSLISHLHLQPVHSILRHTPRPKSRWSALHFEIEAHASGRCRKICPIYNLQSTDYQKPKRMTVCFVQKCTKGNVLELTCSVTSSGFIYSRWIRYAQVLHKKSISSIDVFEGGCANVRTEELPYATGPHSKTTTLIHLRLETSPRRELRKFADGWILKAANIHTYMGALSFRKETRRDVSGILIECSTRL